MALIAISGVSQAAGIPTVLLQPPSGLLKLQEAASETGMDAAVSAILAESPRHSLVPTGQIADDGLETVKFQHFYAGLEVIGSMAMHHAGNAGHVVQNLLARFDLDPEPTLPAETAISIAESVIGVRKLLTPALLKILPSNDEDSARLVYWLQFAKQEDSTGRLVLVDAHSGEVIANLSSHLALAPVQVFTTHASAACQSVNSVGDPTGFNLRACAQVVANGRSTAGADASAVRALNNANRVLTYYAETFQRNSYDGRGAQIVNVVHAGRGLDNAFWDEDDQLMAYGDGDGRVFGDMTVGLDVAGHEQTHAVTSRTAGLLGMGEPGALNEANSDFFGKMIANDGDWLIGHSVMLHPRPGANAIRDLAVPGNLSGPVTLPNGRLQTLPYPANMSQEARPLATCDDSSDDCNVHYNSTIPGHAMYLMANAVGKDVAQKLQYATLTHAMGPRTGFRQYGAAIRSVCQQLFDSHTCQAVGGAFAQVGL